MKTLNTAVKVMAFLLVIGALLFSCSFAGEANIGRLVINVPGSGAGARAVGISSQFVQNLRFEVTCSPAETNTADQVTQIFKAGSTVSLTLAEGEWAVDVSVFHENESNYSLGGSGDTVFIKKGKITTITMNINVDNWNYDVLDFEITGPGARVSGYIDNYGMPCTIDVELPVSEVNFAKPMNYIIIHNGAYAELEGKRIGKTGSFLFVGDYTPYNLRVYAGNGNWRDFELYVHGNW